MSNIDIYDLSGRKFEELALDFLQKQDDLSVIYAPENEYQDLGYDFKSFVKDDDGKQHNAAVEVKHRRNLRRSDLKRIAHNAERIKGEFEGFILVTSAVVNPDDITYFMDMLNNLGYSLVRVYQKNNIDQALDLQSSFMAQKIYKSKEKEKRNLAYAWFSMLIAILGLSFSIYSYIAPTQNNEGGLDSRIKNVEGALHNIKSLEKYLSEIKSDMEKTHLQSKKIQAEYEKSQVLKEMTDSQINAVREALGQDQTSWFMKILDYVLAFILGIAASVVASNIHDRIKRNKELDSPA
ncbi:hypothetical protein [Vibrio cholerae]|uniref:hypothetical protein n=1 Tax=Vibrio cholerae TaxID=666 RepID=UPI0039675F10